MAYWCEKYWERNQKCNLRSCLQKTDGDIPSAVFARVPRDLTYADMVAAVDCLKEICSKCKRQR